VRSFGSLDLGIIHLADLNLPAPRNVALRQTTHRDENHSHCVQQCSTEMQDTRLHLKPQRAEAQVQPQRTEAQLIWLASTLRSFSSVVLDTTAEAGPLRCTGQHTLGMMMW
jgi:hypothetical protein